MINSNLFRVCRSLINGYIVRVKVSIEWGVIVGVYMGFVGWRDFRV